MVRVRRKKIALVICGSSTIHTANESLPSLRMVCGVATSFRVHRSVSSAMRSHLSPHAHTNTHASAHTHAAAPSSTLSRNFEIFWHVLLVFLPPRGHVRGRVEAYRILGAPPTHPPVVRVGRTGWFWGIFTPNTCSQIFWVDCPHSPPPHHRASLHPRYGRPTFSPQTRPQLNRGGLAENLMGTLQLTGRNAQWGLARRASWAQFQGLSFNLCLLGPRGL